MYPSVVFKNFVKLSLSVVTLATIGFTTSSSAKAIVLLSDNFNQENGGTPALTYTNFTNWNVTSGTVDLIGSGTYTSFDYLPGNGLYIDTDGLAQGTLTSKTAFSFNPGDTVTLSFDLAGAQIVSTTSSVVVSLGSLFNQTFTLPEHQGFTQYTETINVTSATTANLQFQSITGTESGLLLDNVQLSDSTPVPFDIPGGSSAVLLTTILSFGTLKSLKKHLSKSI